MPCWTLRIAALSAMFLGATAHAAPLAALNVSSPALAFGGWLVALLLGLALGWFWHAHVVKQRHAQPSAEHVLAVTRAPALLVDSQSRVLRANESAVALLGVTVGSPPPTAPENFAKCVRSALINQEIDDSADCRVGARIYNWLVEPLFDGNALVLLVDITTRKESEIQLRQERDTAREASRVTSDFVSTVSHDIRVPMNGVLGMANLLLETDLTPHQRELGRAVVDSANSVITLTDELLDLAKIEAGKLEVNPQPTELAPLLDELIRGQATRAMEKRLDLACELDPDLPALVTVDPVRLRQILANLISNALKFTEKGEVFVRVWREGATQNATSELRFAVSDTGIGIAPDQKDRLFKAFTQGDTSTYRTYGGTGLGLYTSRQLAELMGGRMWFESQPGRGSTFYLGLPYRPVTGATVPWWTQKQPALEGRRVLVVEDNPRLSALYVEWLGLWGCVATEFRSAKESLAWFTPERTADVALIDLDLPSSAGHSLVEALARTQPKTRRVAISLRPPDGPPPAAGLEVLLKPVSATSLLDTLRRSAPALPVAAPAARPAPAAAPAPAVRATVLVADDDAINQKVMRTYLERTGCQVRIASDGVEALAALEQARPDLLFLDIMMPRLDGLQVVREIRKREAANPGLKKQPVVAITAKVMPGDREAGLAAGFDDYATKPINEQRLRELLGRFVPMLEAEPRPVAAPPAFTEVPGLPLVDRARLDELGSGDPDTVREIVALYFQKTTGLIQEFEVALAAGNLPEARRLAHTAAGSSAACGMMQTQTLFRKVERAVESGLTDEARVHMLEVNQSLEAVRAATADLLS